MNTYQHLNYKRIQSLLPCSISINISTINAYMHPYLQRHPWLFIKMWMHNNISTTKAYIHSYLSTNATSPQIQTQTFMPTFYISTKFIELNWIDLICDDMISWKNGKGVTHVYLSNVCILGILNLYVLIFMKIKNLCSFSSKLFCEFYRTKLIHTWGIWK